MVCDVMFVSNPFPFQLSDDKHPVVKEDIGENVVFCLEEV